MTATNDRLPYRSPRRRYEDDLAQGRIVPDARQARVMDTLQACFLQLRSLSPWRQRWRYLLRRRAIQGVYLHGPVGSGKTYLLDLFYGSLPRQAMRMHFHAFMRMVHRELAELPYRKNPLKLVAKRLAAQAQVICLDEFLVENIVDAMILEGLLKALFKRGIFLVATSNTPPDTLYHRGLQRSRFLPAIALIKRRMRLLEVDNRIDYRRRVVSEGQSYFYPHDHAVEHELGEQFARLAHGPIEEAVTLTLLGRRVATVKRADNAVWFRFDVLCRPPRSQLDYLELARRYPIVFVSGVPHIGEREHDVAALFVRLVDVLYDARTRLALSATVPPDDIYTRGKLLDSFRRTKSRLIEMQSRRYLAHHRRHNRAASEHCASAVNRIIT